MTIAKDGKIANAGIAPHLNMRAATAEEISTVADELKGHWLSKNLEAEVKEFAIMELAQAHLKEVKARRLPEVEKTEREVQTRLQKEINHWDSEHFELKEQANIGKKTHLNWENAQRRAEDLADRLRRRMERLAHEKNIAASSPIVRGGFIALPQGLLDRKHGNASVSEEIWGYGASRREIELIAMDAVIAAERSLGNEPKDVSGSRSWLRHFVI